MIGIGLNLRIILLDLGINEILNLQKLLPSKSQKLVYGPSFELDQNLITGVPYQFDSTSRKYKYGCTAKNINSYKMSQSGKRMESKQVVKFSSTTTYSQSSWQSTSSSITTKTAVSGSGSSGLRHPQLSIVEDSILR